MTTLATLMADDPSRDPQTISIDIESAEERLIHVTLNYKSGRKQSKTYPVPFTIESAAIDVIQEYEPAGYTAVLRSDDLKRFKINWLVEAKTKDDVERAVRILNAVSNDEADPATVQSMVFTSFGLAFSLSKVAGDCSISSTFWSNKLSPQQAACLQCLARLKPRMVDDTEAGDDQSTALSGAIATMARTAQLGDAIDSDLEKLGISYRPVDFRKLAELAPSAMIDF